MYSLKRYILFLIFCCSLVVCFAQSGKLKVSGILADGSTPLSRAIVQVYSQGVLLYIVETDHLGKFNFDLELNKQFEVIFTGFGYVTKQLTIDTHVRENEQGVWSYAFLVDLFPKLFEVDYSVFSVPIAIVKYYPSIAEFDFDEEYDNKIKPQIIHLSSLVKKKRNTQFQNYYSIAGKNLKDNNYIKAIDNYMMASVCDPSSSYPTEKLDYIDKIMSRKSDNYSRYLEMQHLGDSCLLSHAFNKASVFFNEALLIYPNSKYSWYKKSLSDTLNSRFNQVIYSRLKYKDYVLLADLNMSIQNFNTAFYYYNLISEINPADEYAFRQLKALKERFNLTPENSPTIQFEKLVMLADNYLKNGKCNEAHQKYIDASKLNKHDQYVKLQIEKTNENCLQDNNLSFNPALRTKDFLKQLALQYKKGIIKEVYQQDNKQYLRIIIHDGSEADEYIKVFSEFGELYYLNGKEISEKEFARETTKR